MSYNDFRQKINVDVIVTVTGSGEFNPFEYGYGTPLNWTLEGTMRKSSITPSPPIKQQVCGTAFDPQYYAQFGYSNSPPGTGGTSKFLVPGDISTLQYPYFIAVDLTGKWIVNTKPVLSANGQADGDVIFNTAYIVETPVDKKITDPIVFNPPIDFLKRVYPGDIVRVTGTQSRWDVIPQRRRPDPKTTFYWTPNSSPVLKSGGIVDGKLAVPGTIMIPTSSFYIQKEEDYIDGIQYILADNGIYFDGQKWSVLYGTYIYAPKDKPLEFYNTALHSEYSYPYFQDLEIAQYQKPFVSCYLPMDYDSPFIFTSIPEEGDPEVSNLYFKWTSPMDGMEDNIMPDIGTIYDFQDPWSKYWIAQRKWINDRFKGAYGAGFLLKSKDVEPEMALMLDIADFSDGNIYEITQEQVLDEKTLKNTFTISTTITISQ